MMMGFGFIGLVIMFLFWLCIIALAVWIVRAIFQGGNQQGISSKQNPSAKDILDNRYARGEITREQYELMRTDLQL